MSEISIETFHGGNGHFAAAAYFWDDGTVRWDQAGYGHGSSESQAARAAIDDLKERRERIRQMAEAPTLNLAAVPDPDEVATESGPVDLLNPPPETSTPGGEAGSRVSPFSWSAMTLRQRLAHAIHTKTPVSVTYTDSNDNVTTRDVLPMFFEGMGWQTKLALIDLAADKNKSFFVSGISGVEQVDAA